MIESLSLFAGAICVGALVATTLSLYGVHIATRDTSLQSLAISQGAQLGVLLALGFFHEDTRIVPWLAGVLVAFLIFMVSTRIADRVRASKNTVFIVFFLVLLASSNCLVSIFPMLESHQSQSFFGDLVYLAGTEMIIAGVVSAIALIVLLVRHTTWCNRSFLLSTFDQDSLIKPSSDRTFFVVSLALIVTSVFSVGLLLTLSSLFIPSMVLSFVRGANLRHHFIACGSVAFLGVITGFILTLKLEDYPTVPVVVLTYLFFSGVLFLVLDFFNSRRGSLTVGAKTR